MNHLVAIALLCSPLALSGCLSKNGWFDLKLPEHSIVSIESVAVSPDGNDIAAGTSGGRVWVWDTVADEIRFNPRVGKYTVTALAYSPDGAWLAAGTVTDCVRLLDARTGELLKVFSSFEGTPIAIRFSADGARLNVVLNGGTLYTFDTADRELLASCRFSDERLCGACFSPDGKRVAWRSYANEVGVTDVESGEVVWRVPVDPCLTFKPPAWLTTTTLGACTQLMGVTQLDARTGKTNAQFIPEFPPLRFPDDVEPVPGTKLVVLYGWGGAELWDIEQEQRVHEFPLENSIIASARILPGGEQLVTADWDGRLVIWRLEDGARIREMTNAAGAMARRR